MTITPGTLVLSVLLLYCVGDTAYTCEFYGIQMEQASDNTGDSCSGAAEKLMQTQLLTDIIQPSTAYTDGSTTCTSSTNRCITDKPGDDRPISNALALIPYDDSKLMTFHQQERTYTIGRHEITITQRWNDVGVAAVVWDAAVVLAEYLADNSQLVQNQTILELGAGTGVTGIIASLLGGKVTMTDRLLALPVLKENLERNMKNIQSGFPCSAEIRELEWGKDLDKFTVPYQVIIGADIIYIEETFPDLLKTLIYLSNSTTKIILSCKIRYDRDRNFLSMLRKKFTLETIHYDKVRDIYIYSAVRKT